MPAIKTIDRTVELGGNVAQSSFPDPVPAYFFNDETAAHIFVIHARKDGQPFSLTGNVSAVFLNDIGTTVTISTGSIQDGAARVTLTDACYQVSGSFTLTISVSGAVVYECCGTIKRRSSSTAYDPTGEISIAALSTKISEMETATENAQTATTNANNAYTRLINYAPSVSETTLVLPT